MAEKYERNPYVNAQISELSDKHTNVRIIGRIVKKDRESSSVVIDDGKSAVVVLVPSDELFLKAEVGKQVRILGVVLPYEGGVELKADMIQDFESVDKNLYTTIYNKITWQ